MVDARTYLTSFKTAEARIELKLKQIQRLEDRLCDISAPLGNEHVSHTRNYSVMADTVAMIVDIQKEIDQQTSEIFKKRQEAYRLLDQIKPQSAEILIEHFIYGKTLVCISQMTQITKRQIQRRLHDAIIEFQAILEDTAT